ncbi:MAG: hypothetical protein ACI808_000303 [Paraglaciecola sp.]|jgi:hypothetical protein
MYFHSGVWFNTEYSSSFSSFYLASGMSSQAQISGPMPALIMYKVDYIAFMVPFGSTAETADF